MSPRGAPAQSTAVHPRVGAPTVLGTGFVAGLLNGLLGIGGGIVIVPMMLLRARVSPSTAVGTSLAAVVALSTCAFALHVSFTGYRLSLAGSALLIVAGVAGAQLGSRVLRRLTTRWVLITFSVVVAGTAARLIWHGLGVESAAQPVPLDPPLWAYPLLGLVSGVLSGLLGVGGGALVLLGLATLFHMPVQGALPIALAVNVTNALSGGATLALSGHVLWRPVGQLVLGALVGVAGGVALAIHLPPDALRLVFGGFFLLMAMRTGWQGYKEGGAARPGQ